MENPIQEFMLYGGIFEYISISKPFKNEIFKCLQVLCLVNIRIKFLRDDTFEGLSNLETLHLHDLNLKMFHGFVLKPMPNLKHLCIDNGFQYVAPDKFRVNFRRGHHIGHLIRISIVNLDRQINFDGQMERLNFDNVISLKQLILRNNSIEIIPEDTFNNVIFDLEYIDLSLNRLKSLPVDLFVESIIDGSLHNLFVNFAENPWAYLCDIQNILFYHDIETFVDIKCAHSKNQIYLIETFFDSLNIFNENLQPPDGIEGDSIIEADAEFAFEAGSGGKKALDEFRFKLESPLESIDVNLVAEDCKANDTIDVNNRLMTSASQIQRASIFNERFIAQGQCLYQKAFNSSPIVITPPMKTNSIFEDSVQTSNLRPIPLPLDVDKLNPVSRSQNQSGVINESPVQSPAIPFAPSPLAMSGEPLEQPQNQSGTIYKSPIQSPIIPFASSPLAMGEVNQRLASPLKQSQNRTGIIYESPIQSPIIPSVTSPLAMSHMSQRPNQSPKKTLPPIVNELNLPQKPPLNHIQNKNTVVSGVQNQAESTMSPVKLSTNITCILSNEMQTQLVITNPLKLFQIERTELRDWLLSADNFPIKSALIEIERVDDIQAMTCVTNIENIKKTTFKQQLASNRTYRYCWMEKNTKTINPLNCMTLIPSNEAKLGEMDAWILTKHMTWVLTGCGIAAIIAFILGYLIAIVLSKIFSKKIRNKPSSQPEGVSIPTI